MRALLLVVVAGLVLASCGGGGDASSRSGTSGGQGDGGAGEVTTVARGADGPRRAGEVVARSVADWQAAWAAHGGEGAAPSLPPGVDLDHQMIVAVFQGQRPSAGFEVLVESAVTRADGLDVRYAALAPAPDCLTASVITFPFHVVAVGRSDGRVTFTSEDRVKGCGPGPSAG